MLDTVVCNTFSIFQPSCQVGTKFGEPITAMALGCSFHRRIGWCPGEAGVKREVFLVYILASCVRVADPGVDKTLVAKCDFAAFCTIELHCDSPALERCFLFC